jgi:hypothetical protein
MPVRGPDKRRLYVSQQNDGFRAVTFIDRRKFHRARLAWPLPAQLETLRTLEALAVVLDFSPNGARVRSRVTFPPRDLVRLHFCPIMGQGAYAVQFVGKIVHARCCPSEHYLEYGIEFCSVGLSKALARMQQKLLGQFCAQNSPRNQDLVAAFGDRALKERSI